MSLFLFSVIAIPSFGYFNDCDPNTEDVDSMDEFPKVVQTLDDRTTSHSYQYRLAQNTVYQSLNSPGVMNARWKGRYTRMVHRYLVP